MGRGEGRAKFFFFRGRNAHQAIHFVIITKTLCIQLEKDHKKITQPIVSGNSFVIISARLYRHSGDLSNCKTPSGKTPSGNVPSRQHYYRQASSVSEDCPLYLAEAQGEVFLADFAVCLVPVQHPKQAREAAQADCNA